MSNGNPFNLISFLCHQRNGVCVCDRDIVATSSTTAISYHFWIPHTTYVHYTGCFYSC